MPKRKTATRSQGSVTPAEIEMLRRAIAEGFPWICNVDDEYRKPILNSRLNILLSYCTNISCLEVFCSGYSHPSPETVKAVRAALQADINEAERRFESFDIERWSDADFRSTNPGQPPREEY
jgi:hypothetical protein